MPTFKIITDDGHHRSEPQDPEELLDYPDSTWAIADAQVALGEIARDRVPTGQASRFSVEVADETGNVIYSARLDFAEWRADPGGLEMHS